MLQFIYNGSLVTIMAVFTASDGSNATPTAAQVIFVYTTTTGPATVTIPLTLVGSSWNGTWDSSPAMDGVVTWTASCSGPLVASAVGNFFLGSPLPVFVPTTIPTIFGFIEFIRLQVGINSLVLPDSNLAIQFAYNVALSIVNPFLANVGNYPNCNYINGQVPTSPIYMLAVYNLAADNLINFTQDVVGSTYFADLRKQWNLAGFQSGVISNSSDQGTSQSLVVQEAAKNFMLADLQYLKTPYGRQYLAFAQRYGSLWDIS